MTVKTSFSFKTPKKTSNEWFEILVILTVSLSMLNCGLSYYWTSPFIPKIVADKVNYDITEEQASYFTVGNLLGIIILPPFITPLINRIGRKKSIWLTSVPCAIVWLIKAFATNLWLLYFARFLSGLGDAVVFAHTYIYVGEVVSPEVRGLWGNALSCLCFLGQFLINVLGMYFSVQATSFICLAVPVSFFVIFAFMPDSPYFYIARGQDEDAKKSLRILRRQDDVDEEFKEIKIAVDRQQSESATWKDLITVIANRKALLAAVFLRVSQTISGMFVFGSYTQFIFQKVGSDISPDTSTLLYTALNFVLYSLGSYFSSKLGRRKSLLYSLTSCGVVLVAEAMYFFIDWNYPEVNMQSIQWFPLAGMLGFLVFSSIGVGIIPALMISELFSTTIASKGAAVVTMSMGVLGFAVNNIFYHLSSVTGLWGPFLLFGLCNFVSTVITYYIIPETKDKTLEQIQLALIKL